MLVLTRMEGEEIRIGDDIVIVVCGFRRQNGRQKVRIGIEAPQAIPVHRGEVYEAIKRNEQPPSPPATV